MKPLLLLVALLHAALVRADGRIAPIFIQPISTSETAPSLLAEIQFDTAGSTSAPEVISYEVPAFPDGARLARVGIYNSDAGTWASSTSVMSLENFDKGYAPHFTVSIDVSGKYLGASLRGVRIDAGQTRDFGPQAAVVVTAPGKQPELNKPVILSPEGKKIVPEEKSFLQKYRPPEIKFLLWQTSSVLTGGSQILVGTGNRDVSPHVWRGLRAEIATQCIRDFHLGPSECNTLRQSISFPCYDCNLQMSMSTTGISYSHHVSSIAFMPR